MNERGEEQTQHVGRSLRTLIRGLAQNSLGEAYEGYKALYKVGAPAIPQVREAVLKSNWSKLKYGNEARYVSGLFSLIHDIDEAEARSVADRLKNGGCAPAVARILDSVCAFTLSDYDRYSVCGAEVFEHKRLVTRQNVRALLQRWLKNVPAEDLREVERIFILRKEDFEGWGDYTPVLFRINIVWDNPSRRWSPMSHVNNFIIERTLYHEIGHHAHRHTFGQDPEQEEAAERYADRIMSGSGHWYSRVGRLLGAHSNKGISRTRNERGPHPQS
ncbi:MAG TPA: hypothetical protein VF591_08715 [Pyrinomonadaceae bacterium]|jgi:hypothetical protein